MTEAEMTTGRVRLPAIEQCVTLSRYYEQDTAEETMLCEIKACNLNANGKCTSNYCKDMYCGRTNT